MPTANQVDAEADQYRRHLDELYDSVCRWVAGRYPKASFSHTPVHLSEEAIGVYQVESLDVAVPGLPAVRFVPRGIFMVGAHGRVDVRSRLGREVLMWVEPSGSAIGNGISLEEEMITRPLFANVAEGWAWSDSTRNEIQHLDENVFWTRLYGPLTQ